MSYSGKWDAKQELCMKMPLSNMTAATLHPKSVSQLKHLFISVRRCLPFLPPASNLLRLRSPSRSHWSRAALVQRLRKSGMLGKNLSSRETCLKHFPCCRSETYLLIPPYFIFFPQHHWEGRGELHRPDRGTQRLHEGAWIQDITTPYCVCVVSNYILSLVSISACLASIISECSVVCVPQLLLRPAHRHFN